MEQAFISVPLLKRGTYHRQVADFRRTFIKAYPPTLLKDSSSLMFDAPLEAEVVRFQRANGLQPTGQTDDLTWAKILGVSVDRVATYDLENETPPSSPSAKQGTNPLLWIAVAAAAWWALS